MITGLFMSLGLLGFLQENPIEQRVSELITILAEGDIEARDDASQSLARLGVEGLEVLKKAAEGAADPEVRARLRGAIYEIQRLERVKEYMRPSARITVQNPAITLEDAAAKIAEQGGVKIKVRTSAFAKDPVALAIDDATVFESVEALCRAHGKIRYGVLSGNDGNVISIRSQREGGIDPPRSSDGDVLFEMDSLTLVRTLDLSSGASASSGSLTLRLAIVGGLKPISCGIRLEEVTGSDGQSYLEGITAERDSGFFGSGPVTLTPFTFTFTQIPPDSLKVLSKIRGRLEMAFPLDVETLVFEDPVNKPGQELLAEGRRLVLRGLVPEGKDYKFTLEVFGEQDFSNTWNGESGFKLYDAEGKSYESHGYSARGGGDSHTYTYEFSDVPKAAVLKELRMVMPKGRQTQVRRFEFTDVRIR